MFVKEGLKHNKRQYIAKMKRWRCDFQYININKKYCWFKEEYQKHGSLLHYNIRADTMLGIDYTANRRIPCTCS